MPPRRPPPSYATRSSLRADLRAMGIGPGDVVMTHGSLKRLGLVIGGARAVVEALYDAVGREGTIMMTAFSSDLSDPCDWYKPPVSPEWWDTIRAETPAYDPALTPSNGIGAVAEYFRTYPGVLRSPHPMSSFTARGPAAERLVGEHPLDYRFGPDSPLGRLVELDGKIALIGAPYESITLFHYTQHYVGWVRTSRVRSPVMVDGAARWMSYKDVRYPWHWFPYAAEHLIEQGIAKVSRVGATRAVIFPAAETVEAITEWRKEKGV